MKKLYYYTHLLLNTKYKFLIYIITYILTYTLLTNSLNTTECMNQNPSTEDIPQIAPRPRNPFEHIRNLENEIARLHTRIDLLERGLRYNLDQRLAERLQYESLLRIAVGEIHELRENLHNSYQTITETNQFVNRLLQENATLRLGIAPNESGYTSGLDSNSDNT